MMFDAVIMGAVYDPESDRQIVLLSVDSQEWEKFQRERDNDVEVDLR